MTNWPHAPPHFLQDQSIYMVTAGTFLKVHFFQTEERLKFLHDSLLSMSRLFGWELHAWAVFSNHYHFVAKSPADPSNLRILIAKLHYSAAKMMNEHDHMPNRKVWYQYWDSKITIHTSYLARLNYVHQNPVKHGIVARALLYPWCSPNQFEMQASKAFVKSVYSFDYVR
jgi:putative transposase